MPELIYIFHISSLGQLEEEAMILKLLLFSSLLILSSSQEDDDAGNETAECDLVSQPTSLLRVVIGSLHRHCRNRILPLPALLL